MPEEPEPPPDTTGPPDISESTVESTTPAQPDQAPLSGIVMNAIPPEKILRVMGYGITESIRLVEPESQASGPESTAPEAGESDTE